MPDLTLNRQKVHDAIVAAVADAKFYSVTYHPETNQMIVAEEAVRPSSVDLNEVVSTFRPASRNRRTLTHERDRWVWELILKFQGEVTVEDFERRFTDRGLLVVADPVSGQQQVRVELEEAPYNHPPQGQPSNGTTVRFTLNARVHPK